MKFYDTCSMLELQHRIFDTPFAISSITPKELENIKTSKNKSEDIRYKARKLARQLVEHDGEFAIAYFEYEEELQRYPFLLPNDDSRIVLSAYYMALENKFHEPIEFITGDYSCYLMAKRFEAMCPNLIIKFHIEEDLSDYTGFKTIVMDNDLLADFYQTKIQDLTNPFKMLVNEYLLIVDKDGKEIDSYKYTEDGFKSILYQTIEDYYFGTTKPKDVYQKMAIDSLKRNKITMLRGSAGTGKSYLAMTYLFEQLNQHKIDTIIVFCNTVATSGAAKLGYYPGDKDEKLLDSQIGNFLRSKLGDKDGSAVEQLMGQGKLLLLPMSDIRGYDTTGMNAGIYITEAQNLDVELMRLALQRIGEDSFCILDGDSDAQVDLPQYAGNNNGMRRVSEVFRGDICYGEVTLQNIYRSRIAQLAQLM